MPAPQTLDNAKPILRYPYGPRRRKLLSQMNDEPSRPMMKVGMPRPMGIGSRRREL